MNTQWRLFVTAPRFMPLVGVTIGAVGGAVYWLGAQLWPTSIAVVLSMLATALLSARADAPAPSVGVMGFVFALLVKYNALMALSAANLPFALPANLALGLIMIAGHAASRALLVSAIASPNRAIASPNAALASSNRPELTPTSHGELGVALVIGFAPAVLIGIPGLIGLVVAIVVSIVYVAYLRRSRPAIAAVDLDMTRQLTEVCFYLGALATWAYI
jgi:adenosylcobinamide-GDP ribazoletransferase